MRHGCHAIVLTLALAAGGCLATPDENNQLRKDPSDAASGADAGDDAADPNGGDDVDPSPDVGADLGPCDGACDEDHCIEGTCVECVNSMECDTLTAAFCDPQTNTCVECDGTAGACEKFEDTQVCDEGVCVECSFDNPSACNMGENVCDPTSNVCTDRPVGVVETCEACISDADCVEEHFCVPLTFAEADEPYGTFCMPLENSPSCGRPFTIPADLTSVNSETQQSFCVFDTEATTCPAVRALLDAETCEEAEECSPAIDGDAVCEDINADAAVECTYSCNLDGDCPIGYTCSVGGFCTRQ